MKPSGIVKILMVAILLGGFAIGFVVGTARQKVSTGNKAVEVAVKVGDSIIKRMNDSPAVK